MWRHIPGGSLPPAFQEDGNTTWAVPNYGHRDQPGQATTDSANAENHYLNEDGSENQRSGCVYRAEDFPGATISNVRAGDVLNVRMEFRGEIRRNGRVVRVLRWTGINLTDFTLS